ncbi:hypothetical protein Aoki45_07000 [Algoriphagus sp. oki45]|nr:hypothetical protein Aoki45_07000 [Algoriphagus sp. oki45]
MTSLTSLFIQVKTVLPAEKGSLQKFKVGLEAEKEVFEMKHPEKIKKAEI